MTLAGIFWVLQHNVFFKKSMFISLHVLSQVFATIAAYSELATAATVLKLVTSRVATFPCVVLVENQQNIHNLSLLLVSGSLLDTTPLLVILTTNQACRDDKLDLGQLLP